MGYRFPPAVLYTFGRTVGNYKNKSNTITPASPQSPIDVSITVHVRQVSFILRLKYSLTSQKPPSFTCASMMLPEPMARTISSGHTSAVLTRGNTIPAVVIPATVAEPRHTLRMVAMSQPRIRGDIPELLRRFPIQLL